MIGLNGRDGLKVIYVESTRAVKELEPMKSFLNYLCMLN